MIFSSLSWQSSKNSTPRSIKLSLKNVEMDLLSEGNIRLPASITLTFTFKSVSKEANSRPITPPPTIAILSGSVSICNISSLDKIF